MLTNATITRIDRKGTPGADGQVRHTPGSAVSIRCAIDQVSSRQRHSLGATLGDADAVVYVERHRLQAAGEETPAPPTHGDRLMVQGDLDASAWEAEIATLGDRTAPSGRKLSHLELFVRRAPL